MRRDDPIIAIDLLRFACAALVVLNHFGAIFWWAPDPHGRALIGFAHGAIPPGALARLGWVGVELFFVISGLVIARSARGVDRATFLRRRALRLLPAAWLCASITVLALAAAGLGPAVGAEWLRALVLWPTGPFIDGCYWTLGIEGAFYLAVMLAIGTRGTAAGIERLAMVIGTLSTLFWAVTWPMAPDDLAHLATRPEYLLMLLPHGALFAAGVLLAAELEDSRRARWPAIILFLAVGCREVASHAHERAMDLHHPVSAIAAIALFGAGIALIAAAGRLQPRLARHIAPRTARTLGLLTYPLYLLHQDASEAIIALLVRAGVPLPLAAAIALVAVVLLALVVALRLEPALRGWLAQNLRAAPRPLLAPAIHG